MNYVKLHSAIWDNPKFLALPNDTAKLAYVRVLSAAKASDPQGQWPGREYLEAQLRGDRWAVPHIESMIGAGLLAVDAEGVVSVPQWMFWQTWEGKRPASQLATEAPALLEKRRNADARRQKIKYWLDRVIAGTPLAEVPEDIRAEVIAREDAFAAETSESFSAETHDHTDVRTDGRMYSASGGVSGGDSAGASSPPPPISMSRVMVPAEAPEPELEDLPF